MLCHSPLRVVSLTLALSSLLLTACGPDTPDAPIAEQLATHPAIGIVDFTGGPAFGGAVGLHQGAQWRGRWP
jgi:hypothetical protein